MLGEILSAASLILTVVISALITGRVSQVEKRVGERDNEYKVAMDEVDDKVKQSLLTTGTGLWKSRQKDIDSLTKKVESRLEAAERERDKEVDLYAGMQANIDQIFSFDGSTMKIGGPGANVDVSNGALLKRGANVYVRGSAPDSQVSIGDAYTAKVYAATSPSSSLVVGSRGSVFNDADGATVLRAGKDGGRVVVGARDPVVVGELAQTQVGPHSYFNTQADMGSVHLNPGQSGGRVFVGGSKSVDTKSVEVEAAEGLCLNGPLGARQCITHDDVAAWKARLAGS